MYGMISVQKITKKITLNLTMDFNINKFISKLKTKRTNIIYQSFKGDVMTWPNLKTMI